MAALMSFPPSTSAGMDGIRAKHLTNLVSKKAAAAGDQLKIELSSFVNYILRGELPAFILPLFYGARLIALNKKDGGVRPIAVGNTLRRLATEVGMASEAAFSVRSCPLYSWALVFTVVAKRQCMRYAATSITALPIV